MLNSQVRIPPEEDGYPDPRHVYNITDKSLKRGATLFADPNPNTGSETTGRSHTLSMTKAELDKHARKVFIIFLYAPVIGIMFLVCASVRQHVRLSVKVDDQGSF